MQLIHLRSEDNSKLVEWIQQKTDKYMSGEMQNEMIKVMALCVLRKIAENLQKSLFFTVMVDETTDEFVSDGWMKILKFKRNLLVCLK